MVSRSQSPSCHGRHCAWTWHHAFAVCALLALARCLVRRHQAAKRGGGSVGVV